MDHGLFEKYFCSKWRRVEYFFKKLKNLLKLKDEQSSRTTSIYDSYHKIFQYFYSMHFQF